MMTFGSQYEAFGPQIEQQHARSRRDPPAEVQHLLLVGRRRAGKLHSTFAQHRTGLSNDSRFCADGRSIAAQMRAQRPERGERYNTEDAAALAGTKDARNDVWAGDLTGVVTAGKRHDLAAP
jgi:hypothetical protein